MIFMRVNNPTQYKPFTRTISLLNFRVLEKQTVKMILFTVDVHFFFFVDKHSVALCTLIPNITLTDLVLNHRIKIIHISMR